MDRLRHVVEDVRACLAQGHFNYTVDAGSGPFAIGDATVASFGWVANTSSSKWISSVQGGSGPPDTTYNTTFSLAGFDPCTAQITGMVSGDNGTMVYLNGNRVLDDSESDSNPNPWTQFVPITISSGFVSGINTLSFVTPNGGGDDGPGGLQAQLVGTASVPEPSSVVILASGLSLAGLVVLSRRAVKKLLRRS